jgi:hypothetical protein
LKITDLTLALHVGEGSTHVQSFSLDGRPDAQAGQWLSEQLGARGLDAHSLNAPSPYEMRAHAVSQDAAYGPAGLTDALAELAAWFGNAGLSLGSIQRQMIGRKFAASPVRCWPHHFDLATLTTLPARNADATGYVGAGLSPGDEYYYSMYRSIPSPILRRCRACQRSVIGICAISWRPLRRLIRSSRSRTNRPRPMISCGPRSTARSRF